MNKGLPQGSILSPILFNIYIADIINKLTPSCKLISFADDILIYCSDKNIDIILDNLSVSADNINNWLLDLNLSISVEKSRFMVLSHNKSVFKENEFQIEIGNNSLSNCFSIKYLGVHIESNLKWETQIKFLRGKTRNLINMFRSICKIDKGMHPSIGIKVYKQFIRPALDWGGFLIQESPNSWLKKLDVIQNSALRVSLGCIRTTPINVLLHLAGVNSLSSRRIYLTEKFIVRQFAQKDSLLILKLTLLDEKLAKIRRPPNYLKPFIYKCWAENKGNFLNIYRNNKPITYMIPYQIQYFDLDIDISLGKEIRKSKYPSEKFFQFLSNSNDIESCIYTDGSKNDLNCSFAFCLPNIVEMKARINASNSIFSAEAYAILYALKWIRDNAFDNVGIFSDSLSVLKRLKSIGLRSESNHVIGKILSVLYELIILQGRKIKFFWIPSHIGIPGNEMVDELAKDALNNNELFLNEFNFLLDSDQCECGGIESFIKFMNTKGIMRYDDVCKILNVY